MLDVLLVLTLAALVAVFLLALWPRQEDGSDEGEVAGEGARLPRRPGPGLSWVPMALALVVATALLLMDLPLVIVGVIALFAGIAGHVALSALAMRRETGFELALASALDLVVASLRSGAALVESLGTAASESRNEVGKMMNELCDRVRLGEAAAVVLEDLVERYPQEGARLFAFTLSAHFDSGGSAATSLSEVSRAIRDRIDVVRRATSQTVETQASVVGILAITYGLALLMWNQYPERVEGFASNVLGRSAIAFSILLQALGLAWISRMTKVEV